MCMFCRPLFVLLYFFVWSFFFVCSSSIYILNTKNHDICRWKFRSCLETGTKSLLCGWFLSGKYNYMYQQHMAVVNFVLYYHNAINIWTVSFQLSSFYLCLTIIAWLHLVNINDEKSIWFLWLYKNWHLALVWRIFLPWPLANLTTWRMWYLT